MTGLPYEGSSYWDQEACLKCRSTRLIGAPDCQVCKEPTDKCADCGTSQHDCPVQLM